MTQEQLKDKIQEYIDLGFTKAESRKQALKEYNRALKDNKGRYDEFVSTMSKKDFADFGIHLHRYKGNFYKYNYLTKTWYNFTDVVGSNQIYNLADILRIEFANIIEMEYGYEHVSDSAAKQICANILSRMVANSVHDKHDINKYEAIFTNGIYDVVENKFRTATPDNMDVIPFSPFQIKYDYDAYCKPVKLVDDFLDALNPDDPLTRKAVLQFIGSCLFPHNPSVFFILYSKHSTSGKGTIIELIRKLVSASSVNTDKFFKNSNQFALSGLQDANAAYFNELPEHISKDINEKIKDLADSASSLTIERKGSNQQDIANTHSWFATTNKILTVHNPESALKKRIIWVELKLNQNTSEFKFGLKDIEFLTNDKKALEYLIKIAIDEYKLIAGGSRNTNWALPKSNENFWLIPITENKAVEILMATNDFDRLITQKCSFVTNDDMNMILHNYRQNNSHEKSLSLQAFKKSLIVYLENIGCVAEIPHRPRTIDGRSKRVLEIQWPQD